MKKVILVARIVLFTVVLIWVLGLLMIGLLFHEAFLDYMRSIEITQGITLAALVLWYWLTLVVAGVLVANWGFRRVGLWERKEAADAQESTEPTDSTD